MPSDTDDQAPQTDTNAGNEPTTDTPQSETVSEIKTDPVMDALGIDAEIQAQLPKDEPEAKEPEKDPEPKPPEAEKAEPDEEKAEPDEDEEEEEVAADKEQEPVKGDKRQKRISKLTRQKHELEEERNSLKAKLQDYEDRFEKLEGKQEQKDTAAPVGQGRLAHITDEKALAEEVEKANAIIEWCDANSKGATDEKGEFIEPEEIEATRKKQEKILLNAPFRQKQIEKYTKDRTEADTFAKQVWPELFDKSSKAYQLASSMLDEFPEVRSSPKKNYVVGVYLEGLLAMQLRAKSNGQKPKDKPRDISPRAFEPRVPIAPHTANPPSREVRQSSKQKVNDAMTNLVNDPDGGAESLAKVFAAEEAQDSGRKMVKV